MTFRRATMHPAIGLAKVLNGTASEATPGATPRHPVTAADREYEDLQHSLEKQAERDKIQAAQAQAKKLAREPELQQQIAEATAREAVTAAVRDPDEAAKLASDRAVIARATHADETTKNERERARREREQFAFGLYGNLRSDHEIIRSIQAEFDVSKAVARGDVERVRAIASSWRDGNQWTSRRDQHVLGLRKLFDHAMAVCDADGKPYHPVTHPRPNGHDGIGGHFPDADLARKIMGQMALVEGFNAPSKATVQHGGAVGVYGIGTTTTLPDGPGVVGGVDIRLVDRATRDAMLLLLDAPAALGTGDIDDPDAALDVIDAESDER